MSIRSDFRATKTNRTAGKAAAGATLIVVRNLGGLLLLIAP